MHRVLFFELGQRLPTVHLTVLRVIRVPFMCDGRPPKCIEMLGFKAEGTESPLTVPANASLCLRLAICYTRPDCWKKFCETFLLRKTAPRVLSSTDIRAITPILDHMYAPPHIPRSAVRRPTMHSCSDGAAFLTRKARSLRRRRGGVDICLIASHG